MVSTSAAGQESDSDVQRRNIMRDETVFPNAHSFDASRFVDKGGDHNDIVNAVFGFGRRICPGMYLIDSSIWLLLATMLATVDLSKATADDGSLIEPCVRYQNRVFRRVVFLLYL
jgi:cytochrome P450